jgi:hypothetical protein
MPKYILQNRYQDSGWENLRGEVFRDIHDAVWRAAQLSTYSIHYGMVRVVCSDTKAIVIQFGAGV